MQLTVLVALMVHRLLKCRGSRRFGRLTPHLAGGANSLPKPAETKPQHLSATFDGQRTEPRKPKRQR